jgi:hypothetical protein
MLSARMLNKYLLYYLVSAELPPLGKTAYVRSFLSFLYNQQRNAPIASHFTLIFLHVRHN